MRYNTFIYKCKRGVAIQVAVTALQRYNNFLKHSNNL